MYHRTDAIRLQIVAASERHVRRRHTGTNPVLLRYTSTSIRRDGKDDSSPIVSQGFTIDADGRRIYGKETSPSDRVGRPDASHGTRRGHGATVHTGMSPKQTLRPVLNSERIRPRNQIENHHSEHHLPSADEKRAGRLSDHHLGETTLSRTLESAHRDARRCHFDALRVSGRRHVAASRRHLQIENCVFLGEAPMVYVPRKDIRGKNPTGRESRVEYWKSKCIEELLRTTKKVQKKVLLQTIDKSQLKALSEIAHNVVKGTIALTPSDKTKLKRYKKNLSIVGRTSSTRRERL